MERMKEQEKSRLGRHIQEMILKEAQKREDSTWEMQIPLATGELNFLVFKGSEARSQAEKAQRNISGGNPLSAEIIAISSDILVIIK